VEICKETSTRGKDFSQLENKGSRCYHGTMKHIEVAAAVLLEHNTVFAARRGNSGPLGGKWEFPGGKLEEGEDGCTAIVREIAEELKTRIEVVRPLITVSYQYPTFFVTMHAFLCRRLEGNLELTEHGASCWIGKEDLYSLDWSEADLPVVREVEKLLV